MASKRTWLWVLVAVVGSTMAACLTVVGGSVWLVTRSLQVQEARPDRAEQSFREVLARFEGQTPLVRLTAGEQADTSELEARARRGGNRRSERLEILAWDADDRKLIRLHLPLWLLKLSWGHPMTVDVEELDLRQLRVDPADLERAGPALLLDQRHDGDRVLLWTE